MNPIQSYFRWHDAKYLAHNEDRQKNRAAIRLFRTLRVLLFLVTLVASALLVVATALAVSKPGFLPTYGVPLSAVAFCFSLLFYTWVTEALLFRQYVEDHRNI
jgi:hypothetical protein